MDYDRFILFLDEQGTPFLIRRSAIDSAEFSSDTESILNVRGGMYSDSPSPKKVKGNLAKVQEILNQHLEVFPTTRYEGEIMGHTLHIDVSSK